MKRMIVSILASAVTWPLASYADGLDIPALGVHIAQMPADSKAPEVTHRSKGDVALLQFGKVTLVIVRVEAPVAAGTDVRDASFRASERPVGLPQDPYDRVNEEATKVGGYDAWTIVGLHAESARTIDYSCVTYVIVDQHLYRFLASATGGRTMPPDFISAVRAMTDLTFRPVERSALPVVPELKEVEQASKSRLLRKGDWYPPPAQRRSDQGVVDLEYSVDERGRARSVRQLYSVSATLAAAANEFLANVVFGVDPTWSAKGYSKLRFVFEVQFWLADAPPCPTSPPPRIPAAEVESICVVHIR